MKGHIFSCILFIYLICLSECQITFSRNWVRGKLVEDGKNSEGLSPESVFLREGKTFFDVKQHLPTGNFDYDEESKVLYLRERLLHDLLQNLQHSGVPRVKTKRRARAESLYSE